MAAPPARARADYDYLIKLLLIGDSGAAVPNFQIACAYQSSSPQNIRVSAAIRAAAHNKRMNSKEGNGIVKKVNLMHKPIRKSADKRQTINELQEELRRTREQLAASESQKKHLQNEHEHAKKQLISMHEKYMKSEQGKNELAASEEARIQELREVFQDMDRSWQSELEAVQNSCMNEIQSVNASI